MANRSRDNDGDLTRLPSLPAILVFKQLGELPYYVE